MSENFENVHYRAFNWLQWAKIVVSLERAVAQKDAQNYLQEYSIKLGPGDDPNNPASEQRGVLIIKSKSKTKAKQRKGAVANWKVTCFPLLFHFFFFLIGFNVASTTNMWLSTTITSTKNIMGVRFCYTYNIVLFKQEETCWVKIHVQTNVQTYVSPRFIAISFVL